MSSELPLPSTRRVRKYRALAEINNLINLNEDRDADDEEEIETGDERREVNVTSDQDVGADEPDNVNNAIVLGDEIINSEMETDGNADDEEEIETGADEPDNVNNAIVLEDEIFDPEMETESEESSAAEHFEESISSSFDVEFIDDILQVEEEPNEINELRKLAVTGGMKQSTVGKMLTILRQRLLPELPKSPKTFLGTSSAVYDIKQIPDSDGSVGEYVYFSIEKGLRECIDLNVHKKSTIFLQFNADGIALTKSGEKGFWVISGRVFYTPDIYKSFAILIYSGNSKPASIHDYMSDFIKETNKLTAHGIITLNTKFNVRVHCFVCDTPARAFLKSIKGHTGFYSCERCEVRGLKQNRVTPFPLTNCPERTDDSFRRRSQRRHHKGLSPILKMVPLVNMVFMFVLDFMHLFCEGMMKRLLMTWFVSPRRGNLGQQIKQEVSRRLLKIRKCIPIEFQRKIQSLKALKKWKATEFRFFLLYCGPIVLCNKLDEHHYKNFLLLHTACRILCNDSLINQFQQHAKNYLQRFFVSLGRLYSNMQVLNMHCAIHVADDVLTTGSNFNGISAFPFENFLGKLTGLLRSANRPLAQICRRLHELSLIDPPKPHIPFKIEILKCVEENILKLRYRYCTLTTMQPNNFVMLQDKTVFEILKITRNFNGIEIKGIPWRKERSLFMYPTDLSDLYMWMVVKEYHQQLLSFNINHIKCKIVTLKMNLQKGAAMKVFCSPLLHHL